MTHRVDPTLPHSLSTAKIINTAAVRLPRFVQCPGHPEILVSQGPIREVTSASARRGQVEARRGALVEGGGSGRFRRLSPQCRCLSLHLDGVSSPRSSNRACGFPALDSRSRSCLRPREAALPRFQAFQAVALPQPLVRKAHDLPRIHFVLPAQPLARVRVNAGAGRARLPQTEVVRPAEQHSVQPLHDRAFVRHSVPRRVNSLIM